MGAKRFSRSLVRLGLQGILFAGVLSLTLWPVRASGQGQNLLEQAKKEGMITMLEDGIVKSVQGLTTIEEVLRVVSE